MNRYIIVFLVAVFSCTIAFAQTVDFVDVNLTGSGEYPDNYAAYTNNLDNLNVTNSTFTGGAAEAGRGGSGLFVDTIETTTLVGSTFLGASGGSEGLVIDTSTLFADGGIGFQLNEFPGTFGFPGTEQVYIQGSTFTGGNGGSIELGATGRGNVSGGAGAMITKAVINLESGVFLGGQGGKIIGDDAREAVADGGDGLLTGYDGFILSMDDNVSATGGDGGKVSGTFDSASAAGGSGVVAQGYYDGYGYELTTLGGTYRGGAGGSIVKDGTSVVDGADVSGGDGMYAYVAEAVISNGTFVGGSGGTISGPNTDSSADGGAGLYVYYNTDLQIYDGSFKGGQAGQINGTAGTQGAGLRVRDGVQTMIYGGTFSSILMESVDFNSVMNIVGADEIGDVTLSVLKAGSENTATIDSVAVGDIYFAGIGNNNLTIDRAATFGDLHLDSATGALSLDPLAIGSGIVRQYSGTVDVNLWMDQHFQDTEISGGTMNFSGQEFNHAANASLSLLDVDSEVNFANGFTAQSNSQIQTTFDGTSSSLVKGTDLEFKEGAKWAINGGDTVIVNGTTIAMAEGTGLIVDLDINDVMYMGSGGSWLGDIITYTNTGTALSGTYGYQDFEKALALDPDSEFGKAMEALSDFTDISTSGDDEYVALKDPTLSQAAANGLLKSEFAGSTEMANTMIQLQGLFADQIKDRTRSFLRHKNWGTTVASAPQGALGPNLWDRSIDGLNDTLSDATPQKMDVPETYQVWARGYGSFISQGETSDNGGFGGYDATIGGAVLGLDKRFNNLLIGLGGGYANSDVKGGWGSDGQAETLYGTAYGAMTMGKAFLELSGNYAFNEIETRGSSIVGAYEGEYDADTISMYFGGGIGIPVMTDSILLTPEASILSTYYERDSYSEKATSTAPGPFPDKEWDAYDQWSYLGAFGATLSMIEQFESFNHNMEFQPEIRAHWLHEFNAEMDNETYLMQSTTGPGTPQEAVLQARQENLVKLGAGIRFSKWNSDALEFGVDIDFVFGEDYEAYVGSAKLLHRF